MMNTRIKTYRRTLQRIKGFTLTEIAIVLGIIGLILGAIWTAASAVYTNQRTAHANTAVLQIAQGIRTLYSTTNQLGSTGDITSSLINAGAVPSDLITGSTLTGPFPNGTTKVYGDTDSAGFAIFMSNVPAASCINLVAAVGGQNRDPGLFAANGSTTAGAVATGSPLTTAVTPTNTGCSTSGLNTVEFGFTLK